MRLLRLFLLSGALAWLAGCLGGDIVTPSEARKLQSRTQAYDALRARNEDIPNTAWLAMPTAGTAQFNGVIALRVGQDDDRTRLVGDASVTVDFGTENIDGRLDRFFGVDGDRDLAEYLGSIIIDNGRIGGERPNTWQADYAGTLRGNDQRIVTDGTIGGNFQGTPVRVLEGQSDSNDLATINGRDAPIRLDLVAEQ